MDGQSQVTFDGSCAILSVEGYHDADAAELCASRLEHFTRSNVGGVDVLVDIRHISGFSSEARQRWQACFKQISAFVESITIVGGTPLARMTGSAVCLYAGIKFATAPSVDSVLSSEARSAN